MDTRRLVSDIFIAFFAQALSVLVSTLTTLILPKFLGIEAFGYWQLFIFYIGYVGFFHLGINDGVYLIFGGQARSNIDKRNINSQFAFSCFYQLCFSAIIFGFALLGPFDSERAFVVGATATLLTINNAGLFLGYLFQALNETKTYSFSCVAESAVLLAGFTILIALGVCDFEPYIVLYCLSRAARLVFCLIKAKEFLVSGFLPTNQAIRQGITSIKVGIQLMVSNIMGQLIIGVVRFFVDLKWGIEVFSVVSFSLSIATFFLMFLSQVSMVLFPHLRQSKADSIREYYCLLRDSLSLFLPVVYLLYPLIAFLLNLWLPEYSQGISLFIFLFPICVFDGKMDIVGATYLKVLRKERKLLEINLLTLGASIAVTLLGAYIIHSIAFILVGVVTILGFRSFITERLLERTMGLSHSTLSWAIIPLSLLFIVLFSQLDQLFAFASYLICYLFFLAINAKTLKQLQVICGRR